MPSVFKQATKQGVGTTREQVLSVDNGYRATIVGFNITNVTDYDVVRVTVILRDPTDIESFYARNIPIPPNTSLKLITHGEKLIVPGRHKVDVVCDTDESLDVVISYVELS